MNELLKFTGLANLILVRTAEGDVKLGVTDVSNEFMAEIRALGVQPTPADYARLLIVEAAGRMAARDRKIPGAHLRPVN